MTASADCRDAEALEACLRELRFREDMEEFEDGAAAAAAVVDVVDLYGSRLSGWLVRGEAGTGASCWRRG